MECDQALLQRDKNALSEYSKNNLTTISGERWIKNKSLQTLKVKKNVDTKTLKRGVVSTHIQITY